MWPECTIAANLRRCCDWSTRVKENFTTTQCFECMNVPNLGHTAAPLRLKCTCVEEHPNTTEIWVCKCQKSFLRHENLILCFDLIEIPSVLKSSTTDCRIQVPNFMGKCDAWSSCSWMQAKHRSFFWPQTTDLHFEPEWIYFRLVYDIVDVHISSLLIFDLLFVPWTSYRSASEKMHCEFRQNSLSWQWFE